MTSEGSNHNHNHHHRPERTRDFRHSPTCQHPPSQLHLPPAQSQNLNGLHGDAATIKDETDAQTLRRIGQQLAEIGDEVNARYTMMNRFIDVLRGSIRFILTLHVFPFVRISIR